MTTKERVRSGVVKALDYFGWLLGEHPTTILVLMAFYALATEQDILTIIFLLAGILNELVMIRGSIDGR